jgi:O-antigen/teichoic acid export membrane protein
MNKITVLFKENKYFNNLSWSLAEQVIRLLANFIISIWVIRYFGAELFGEYSYIMTLATIMFVLSRFGLNDVLIKELVAANTTLEKEQLVTNAILLKLIVSFFLFFIGVVLSFVLIDDKQIMFGFIIAIFGMFFTSFDVIENFSQANVNIKPIAIAKNIQLFFSVILKFLFIYFEFEMLYFVLLFLLETVFLSMIYILIYIKLGHKPLLNFKAYSRIKELIKSSWPIAIANLAIIGYVKTDQIMIFNWLGAEDAGIYSAATKLSEAWYFIPTIIATTLFTKVLRSKEISVQMYEESLSKLIRLELVVSITFATIITIIGAFLVEYAFGSAFEQSAMILKIHIWAGVFISLNRVSTKWFITEGFERKFMNKCILGLLLNVIFNTISIPIYGTLGAAVSTLLSLFFVEFIYYLNRPYTKMYFTALKKAIWLR